MQKLFTIALTGLLLATAACSKSDSEENKEINAHKTTMNDVNTSLEDIETAITEFVYGLGKELSPNQQMIIDALQPCEKSTESQATIFGDNCPIQYSEEYSHESNGTQQTGTRALVVQNPDLERLLKFNYLRFVDNSTYEETATQELATSSTDGNIRSAQWGEETRYFSKNNYVGTYQGSKNNVSFKMDSSLSIKSEKFDIVFLVFITGTAVTNNDNIQIEITSANCLLNGTPVSCIEMIGEPGSKVTAFQNSFKK